MRFGHVEKGMRRLIPIGLAALLVVAGCTSAEDTELSTTSSLVAGGSPVGETTTTLADGESGSSPAPSTTLLGEAITEHRQVHSEDTDNGPVLHLVIPRGGYTEIDVESFVREVREAHPGLWGVELFDNADAQVAFMTPADQRDDDQRTLLSRYHLVTLTEGETLIWRGPFSALGQSMIGS